ncbi:hypothetical protein A167_01049 [Alcanivorax sp. S71-1-4]|uniref:RipA family octameric membrane protein n=1 Tax=Alcanivorax sp. S71-1-4 TaxID=1177159 RepID=UPI00135A0505|nr:hypothetical protein [Alcanivorax sp. S71-1-4]KAF0810018.1 hypothetical protein A167_01049 [Alcanivorax sp. S71-1-4]
MEISNDEYMATFKSNRDMQKMALQMALETRKFEIDLYWRRAIYFWTFIGAAFAGIVAIQASEAEAKDSFTVLVSCLGFVFSCAWVCVNKGSKFWQENWEKHVDLLEDEISGPIYKVVFSLDRKSVGIVGMLTGSSAISVSKVNQMLSIYMSIIWAALVVHFFPSFDCVSEISRFHAFLVVGSILTAFSFFKLGKASQSGFSRGAVKRSTIV